MRFTKHQQTGFTIVELTVVLAIASMLAIYTIRAKSLETDQALARMVGTHVDTVASAAQAYTFENYLSLANTVAIPGIANPLAPTLAELKTKGHLQTGFPDRTPFAQEVRVMVQTTNCPGTACQVRPIAYTASPMVVGGGPANVGNDDNVRFDLLVEAVQQMQGRGAMSAFGNGTDLVGATFSVPNPVPGAQGILASSVTVDNTIYNNFVRMRDTRDPDLQGKLTVQGDITSATGNLGAGTGTDGAGSTCRRAEAQSIGAFILRNPLCVVKAGIQFLATGETEVFADNLRNNANTGGIRADGSIYGTGITGTTLTTTGAVTGGSIQNTTNTGGITAAGTVYGNLGQFNSIVINNSAVVGQPCFPANAAVWGTVGGADVLMRCDGGVWAPVTGTQTGTIGGACPVNGALGVTVGGASLICQGGVWVSTTERMGSMISQGTVIAAHGDTIAKPTCYANGSPRIYLIPQIVDGRRLFGNYYALDTGTNFQIYIVDGTPAPGEVPLIDARALAHLACAYP